MEHEGDEAYAGLIATLGFADYSPRPIIERIRRRMERLTHVDVATYRTALIAAPEQLEELRRSIPNDHTAFFRDASDWHLLATKIVPELLARKEEIRVWSAGCSTGEEAYSFAMLFAEHLAGAELARRVTIFATDASDARITKARAGRFAPLRAAAVPEAARERWMDGDRVRPELRAAVRFVQHDLLAHAPFSRIDLLLCRNVTLYMRPAAQAHVFGKLHVAFDAEGLLSSGPADGIALQSKLFTAFARHLHTPRLSGRRDALMLASGRGRLNRGSHAGRSRLRRDAPA